MNGNPSGRFVVMAAAEQFPGVDFFTRSPNGPFVDMGQTLHILHKNDSKSIERVYLSAETVKEIAAALGLFDGYVHESEIEVPQETDDYLRGYADALKEALGADLLDVRDRLGFVADRLDGLARISAPAESQDAVADDSDAGEPAAADGEGDPVGAGAEGDGTGQPESETVGASGQKRRTARQRRSHDVSGDSSDGPRPLSL